MWAAESRTRRRKTQYRARNVKPEADRVDAQNRFDKARESFTEDGESSCVQLRLLNSARGCVRLVTSVPTRARARILQLSTVVDYRKILFDIDGCTVMSIKRFVDAAYLTIQIFCYLRIEYVIPTMACAAFLGSIKSPYELIPTIYNRNIGHY